MKVFFIKICLCQLLLVYYSTWCLAETRANCSEDVPLKCPDVDTDSMNFRSVTWYKLSNDKREGIIRRGKDDVTLYYSFSRPARFGGNHSLFLPNVTPEDSGSYECAITAPIGGQNVNLKVDLIVNVCVSQADLTRASNVTRDPPVVDLPVVWAVIGYTILGFGKMVLSLISIWVIRAVHSRPSRRRWHKWWS
ncbi:uncharacterized protein [Antennarius striatus]|uniref:uncharacterized protein n=1 Tax=Antennarius striatus TaxID=241820 RepID=UPI0035AF69F5